MEACVRFLQGYSEMRIGVDNRAKELQDRIYLLDLIKMSDGQESTQLQDRAMKRLDRIRLEKVRKINSLGARAASLGAGLLLQKAVAEYQLSTVFFQYLNSEELVLELEQSGQPPFEFQYRYGVHGKPYLENELFRFSLSHSGRYVLLAVSRKDIGADIQETRLHGRKAVNSLDRESQIAERFFSTEEKRLLSRCVEETERKQTFYRLWTKREALGKLTGEGIFTDKYFDNRNFAETSEWIKQNVEWLEVPSPNGYEISICKRK